MVSAATELFMTRNSLRWMPSLRETGKPAYLSIADAIDEDIQNGQLLVSQRLPTMRSLSKVMKLNFTTVARGYAEAQRRGLIESKPGRGTYVRRSVRSQPVHTPSAVGLLDMTMNMAPEPQDPVLVQRLRDGVAGLLEVRDFYSLMRYQNFGGTNEDRQAGADWLAPMVPKLRAERVLVCPGAQSALLALFFVLARAGETICCEAVTYPGVKGIAAHLGIRLKGLPADDDGIDPDAFAAECAINPPKALYLNPTFLNPTTAIMSQSRREAVARIAQRYSVPIIEDDAYGFLPSRTPKTLASLAPELTFYVTGFAKCVGAGLRVGYLVSPNSRYTARLGAALRTTTVMAPSLTIALATQWINDGTAVAATLAVREESRARQVLAKQLLTNAQYAAKPEAFHLWLNVPAPWNRIEFTAHLRAHGVGVVISDTFTVSGTAPEAVRVCLGGIANRQECKHMLEIIADALEHTPLMSA
jgi:DNA-binding transcriptional MocR family regulator